jgi:hypothetical protein
MKMPDVIIPDESNLINIPKEDTQGIPENSEGNPIADTPDDARMIMAWLANSQIMDDGGRPMVMYHGTNAQFDEFIPSKSGEFGPGIYFAPRPGYAKTFGDDIKKVYLKMENPAIITKDEFFEMTMEQYYDTETEDMEGIGPREVVRRLREKGHDGIIGTGLVPTDLQYIVFDPSQVMSVGG